MACKSHGGHLASIGSFEELIFITGLFANENKRSAFFLGKFNQYLMIIYIVLK